MDALVSMLAATAVTLREGIEAALAVGIILGYLKRMGRAELERSVYWGLTGALAASIAGAVVFQRLGLDPDNDVWEGTLMLVAAGFVGSMVVWMWHAGKQVKQHTEARLERLMNARGGATAILLALFTFLIVFREGVETVLFLAALSGTVSANPFYNALGGGLGLLLAVVFGFLLVQGSLRIDLRRFFRVTGVVLLLLVAELAVNGLHEFFEAGLLPTTESVMTVVGLITRNSTSLFVLVLLIALPAGMLLRESLEHKAAAASAQETPVQRRKRRAEARSVRRWTGAAGVGGLALSAVFLIAAATASTGYEPAPVRLNLSGPVLRIPLSELGKHPMDKYTVLVDGVTVRILVVHTKGGKVKVAFDACEICPLKGFGLMSKQVICLNCGAPTNVESIGLKGGCNPIPIKYQIRQGAIVIQAKDLVAGKIRFAKG
jgi:high-affinity iron transporter